MKTCCSVTVRLRKKILGKPKTKGVKNIFYDVLLLFQTLHDTSSDTKFTDV